eukprot:250533-Alexandrium_andersonii.AAC.1
MSASLVGSEMCIRDSRDTVRRRRPAPSTSCLPGAVRRRRPHPGRGGSSCLLYTSDAADDM